MMAVSIGVLMIRARIVGVYNRAPDFGKPHVVIVAHIGSRTHSA